jgi:anti-anti-sigma factor
MEIKVSTENGKVPVTVIHVDGNIDSATYEAFTTKADELINSGSRYILVDLTHTPFVSSAGLRALHSIFNKLRKVHPDANISEDEVKKGISAGTYKSPHLKLLNLSQETQTAFTLSGFDMFIETFTDKDQALASF